MITNENSQLFLDNFARISKICRQVSKHVHRIFPSVPIEDLYAYAIFGAFDAFSHADINHPGFDRFIGKYCYMATIDGASLMLGIPSRRGKRATFELCVRLFTTEPRTINELIESAQEFDWNFNSVFDEVVKKLDIEMMKRICAGTYEGVVLNCLLEGMQLKEIKSQYGIKIRRIRKYVVRLCQIYICCVSNKSYHKYLTRINPSTYQCGFKITRVMSKQIIKTLKRNKQKHEAKECLKLRKTFDLKRFQLALRLLRNIM